MKERKNLKPTEVRSTQSNNAAPFTPYGRVQHTDTREVLLGLSAAVPFLAVACTTLKNGEALSIVMFIVLLPTALLRFSLRDRLHLSSWMGAFLCTMVSLILAALSTTIIRAIQPEITDSLGIYLYLTAAFSVVASMFRGRRIRTPGAVLGWAFQYALGFSACAVFISGVRELLSYNQLWGMPVNIGFSLEGARLPFFGLIFTGLVLGLLQHVAQNLYARYRSVTDDE